MISDILHYLTNPVFFSCFALVIGIAYVYVWVTSLRDLVRPDSMLYALDEDSRSERKQSRPVLKYSGRRVSVRSKAVREDEEPYRARGRRARITRVA